MGFRQVFESLQEAFPQVDFRLLKAVAIEHSNDADAAAEFVIAEVLSLGVLSKENAGGPSGMEDLAPAGSSGTKDCATSSSSGSKDSPAAVGSSEEAVYFEVDEDEEENDVHLLRPIRTMRDNTLVRAYDDKSVRSDVLGDVPGYSNEPNSIMKQVSLEELTGATKSDLEHFRGQTDINSIIDNVVLHHKLHTQYADASLSNDDVVMDDFALYLASGMQMTQPSNVVAEEGNDANFSRSHEGFKFHLEETINNINIEKNFLSPLSEKIIDEDRNSIDKGKISSHEELEPLPQRSVQPAKCQDFISLEANGTPIGVDAALVTDALLSFSDSTLSSSQSSDDIGNPTSNIVDVCDEQNSTFLNESSADLLHLEAEMLSSHELYQNAATVAQSSQFVGIELLESFVDDAKSSKENLVSSMESVINMMADVTTLEEKAKRAREAASVAGQEILNKVEELKRTLKHAKEENDMAAGEVYGEKAILATEARELQSRLLNLSDERDKALLIVEQIRQALELRIVAAEAEIAASEGQKLEKEDLAQAALAEQELIMDSIVQESKRLHQEAEENSKLRDFLMDRGHLVDTLQGEIAVICEDVMALKDRVDSGLPLKKLSQSTASSLASSLSLSSVKSKSPTDVVVQPVDAKKFPPAVADESQMVAQPDDKAQLVDKICLDDQKEPVDDEWEIFEML